MLSVGLVNHRSIGGFIWLVLIALWKFRVSSFEQFPSLLIGCFDNAEKHKVCPLRYERDPCKALV